MQVAKHITLEDFDDNDISALKSGSVQLLPCPDTSGRAILWFAASQVNYKSWKNGVRNRPFVGNPIAWKGCQC